MRRPGNLSCAANAKRADRKSQPWTRCTRLAPWDTSRFAYLRDCSHLKKLLETLPGPASDDPAWDAWIDYVDGVYGERASRRVDVRRFSLLRGIALKNAEHTVIDRTPWNCSTHTASNVRAQGSRAIAVWPVSGPMARTQFARDHEWIEVYRQQIDANNPEGLGYGCWFHRARGTGIWVNVGRTIGLTRTEARARFGGVTLPNGTRVDTFEAQERCKRTQPHKNCACFWCLSRHTGGAIIGHDLLLGPTRLDEDALRAPWNATQLCPAPGSGEKAFSVPCLDGAWALNAAREGFDTVQLVPHASFATSNELELIVTGEACLSGRSRPLGACPPASLIRTGVDARLPCHCDDAALRTRFPSAAAAGWLPMKCFSQR